MTVRTVFAFSDDSSCYLLCSLEVLDDDGKLERGAADMFHKRTIKQQRSVWVLWIPPVKPLLSASEKSLSISTSCPLMGGEKIPQIVEDLKGVIYLQNSNSGPFDLVQDGGEHWRRGWQTADEYLSGNVRQKLRTAQRVQPCATRSLPGNGCL